MVACTTQHDGATGQTPPECATLPQSIGAQPEAVCDDKDSQPEWTAGLSAGNIEIEFDRLHLNCRLCVNSIYIAGTVWLSV